MNSFTTRAPHTLRGLLAAAVLPLLLAGAGTPGETALPDLVAKQAPKTLAYRATTPPAPVGYPTGGTAVGVTDASELLVGTPGTRPGWTEDGSLAPDGSGGYLSSLARGAVPLNTPESQCEEGVAQDWEPTAVGPSGVVVGHLACAVTLGSRSSTEVVRWASAAAVPSTIGGGSVMSGDARGVAVNAAGAALVVRERWSAQPSLVTYVAAGGTQARELALDETTALEGSDLADDGTVVGNAVLWDEHGPVLRPFVAEGVGARPTLLPMPADVAPSYGTQHGPPLLVSPDARLIVRNVADGVVAWDAKRRPERLRGADGFTAYDVNAGHDILGTTELGLAIWRHGTVRQVRTTGLPSGAALGGTVRFNARGEISATVWLPGGAQYPVLLVPSR